MTNNTIFFARTKTRIHTEGNRNNRPSRRSRWNDEFRHLKAYFIRHLPPGSTGTTGRGVQRTKQTIKIRLDVLHERTGVTRQAKDGHSRRKPQGHYRRGTLKTHNK